MDVSFKKQIQRRKIMGEESHCMPDWQMCYRWWSLPVGTVCTSMNLSWLLCVSEALVHWEEWQIIAKLPPFEWMQPPRTKQEYLSFLSTECRASQDETNMPDQRTAISGFLQTFPSFAVHLYVNRNSGAEHLQCRRSQIKSLPLLSVTEINFQHPSPLVI